MALSFKLEDVHKMTALENELAVVLRRANAEHLEAAIAAFACMRCARVLLTLYPEKTREMLVEQVIVPFLRQEAESPIAMPFGAGKLLS
jgi:hypothetical protein